MEEWYHVAVTYDGTNQKIYVNGSLDNTEASAITPATTNVPLYIGRTLGLAPDNSDGFIDEVRIYNRALTPSEVEGLYKSGAAKFQVPNNLGLVGYCHWQVTDDSGTGATDARKQVYALGPEFNFAIPSYNTSIAVRVLKEFEAQNAPQGVLGVLTVTKAF